MLATHAIYGASSAAAIRSGWAQQESRAHVAKLEQELAAREAHRAELATHLEHVQTEARAVSEDLRGQIAELAAHIGKLEQELAAHLDGRRELEEYVHGVEAALARQRAEADALRERLSQLEARRWTRLGRKLRLLRT